MIPSNTICVSQEGPANALALNKDCSQVVIAGRNVFKVFSIGENDFSEVCNLRVGKNLNLNFSSIDVAWSSIEENTLATAATNGAVVVWNLGRSGRSKQEHVFSDHKRTVNKVSFHLTEPVLLISGSQDGMMKCFDLRMKEVARTFISNTESIRDVQFSPHQPHTFAAVSENGSVQLWDVRRHERCLQQFTAHSGPVFACDWHPDVRWLATASRDKTIKVWDVHAKPTLEHTIYTIASVGHVKWRPQKKYQLASCALVLDCAVHVWDVRRPHVPLATFAEHRDVTTAVAWQASPHTFLSTSRDCSLYRHRFSEAAHPVLWANPHGVCISARGELAHCAPERPLPAILTAPQTNVANERLLPGLGRKQPRAGSLSAAAQAALERAFPGGAGSTLSRFRAAPAAGGAPPLAGNAALLECAVKYKMTGGPPHELALYNAEVARSVNRFMVQHVWLVVATVYARRAEPRAARHGGRGADGGGGGGAGGEPVPQQRRAGAAHRQHLHPARQVQAARRRREPGLAVGRVGALRGRGGGGLGAARGGLPAAQRARARRARGSGRRDPSSVGHDPVGVAGRLGLVPELELGLQRAAARARRQPRGQECSGGRRGVRGGAAGVPVRARGERARAARRGAARGRGRARARRARRRADGGRAPAGLAAAQERPVPVHRREPAGAVAAGLHRDTAAAQAVECRHAGDKVVVAEQRVVAVAAVDVHRVVLRALRAPHAAARRVRPLLAARRRRPLQRLPPGGARAVRVVPGLRARRAPAAHARLDAEVPAVSRRLRAPLPARLKVEAKIAGWLLEQKADIFQD